MSWNFLLKRKLKKIRKMPKHIAIAVNGITEWSNKKNLSIEKGWDNSFKIIKEIIGMQIGLDIPIITFNLMPSKTKETEEFTEIIDRLTEFFEELKIWPIITKHKIKISILGKWYDLPNRLVDSIKEVTIETKDYDNFFVNFCINYDGQEEIIDAFRVITRKIKLNDLNPDTITLEEIKDNLYSSYFIPPEMMVVTSGTGKLGGFLLWDSVDTKIYFLDKELPEIKKKDLVRIIQKLFK
jgi:undecaprenyl diphosphate synthase